MLLNICLNILCRANSNRRQNGRGYPVYLFPSLPAEPSQMFVLWIIDGTWFHRCDFPCFFFLSISSISTFAKESLCSLFYVYTDFSEEVFCFTNNLLPAASFFTHFDPHLTLKITVCHIPSADNNINL